jgi:hypothetical protein
MNSSVGGGEGGEANDVFHKSWWLHATPETSKTMRRERCCQLFRHRSCLSPKSLQGLYFPLAVLISPVGPRKHLAGVAVWVATLVQKSAAPTGLRPAM